MAYEDQLSGKQDMIDDLVYAQKKADEEREIARAEFEYDRKLEWAREAQESAYDCWLSDNLDSLMSDFIEESQSDAFNEYCREIYKQMRD